MTSRVNNVTYKQSTNRLVCSNDRVTVNKGKQANAEKKVTHLNFDHEDS